MVLYRIMRYTIYIRFVNEFKLSTHIDYLRRCDVILASLMQVRLFAQTMLHVERMTQGDLRCIFVCFVCVCVLLLRRRLYCTCIIFMCKARSRFLLIAGGARSRVELCTYVTDAHHAVCMCALCSLYMYMCIFVMYLYVC